MVEALSSVSFDGKRVLVLVPDGTRTMPMPLMFALFQELLRPRTRALDYLVALGTHPAMSDAQLSKLVGCPIVDSQVDGTYVFNHRWETPVPVTGSSLAMARGPLISSLIISHLARVIGRIRRRHGRFSSRAIL